VAALLDESGWSTSIVTDPDQAVARLDAHALGTGERIHLLTVNALRWRMEVERYGAQRAEHAYSLSDDTAAKLEAFVLGGGGLLALHTAVICFDAQPRWHSLCGASWNWSTSSHPPASDVDIAVTAAGQQHPITRDINDFRIADEVYGFLDEVDGIEALLTGTHSGREHPVLWARDVGRGRVVTSVLGHGAESLANPSYRTILARAATWATRSAA
jgi:type 1 glutamine amidotransferase